MTSPSTPKKVVSVEILHLDELGYGPQGQHTRRQRRAECLENLLGEEVFGRWQEGWQVQIDNSTPRLSFGYRLVFDDGSFQEKLLSKEFSHTLDFVGQNLQSQPQPLSKGRGGK